MYKQIERYRQIDRQIRIARYVRCSSDEQKKSGYTINDQLDLLEEFSKEYELVGAGTYVDEGVSATLEISKRKALVQLIKYAKAGKFDIVIFKCSCLSCWVGDRGDADARKSQSPPRRATYRPTALRLPTARRPFHTPRRARHTSKRARPRSVWSDHNRPSWYKVS